MIKYLLEMSCIVILECEDAHSINHVDRISPEEDAKSSDKRRDHCLKGDSLLKEARIILWSQKE